MQAMKQKYFKLLYCSKWLFSYQKLPIISKKMTNTLIAEDIQDIYRKGKYDF